MAGNDRMVNSVATEPAKRRSPKARQTTDPVPEAEVVETAATDARIEMAMPPPTVTPHVMPKSETVVIPEPEPAAAKDVPQTPATPEPPAPPRSEPGQAPEKRRGVFFPMLLGGLIAGGIGYGIAYMQVGQTAAADIAGLRSQIEALQAEVANAPPPDLSPVTQDIADLSASVDERLAALDERIATASEQAPVIGEQAQEQAVAQLSDQIAAQQAELEQQRADLQAQLDTTRAEAEQIQQEAVDAARTETARAALARVQGAIESGAPMQSALDDLGSVLTDPVPEALTVVAEGTPTLATLRETFPETSRLALAAARNSGEAGDDTGAFGSFLRNQLNVRSVAPREGTSADAILSRAEDALRNGRLNDALAEIATLPESARAAMSDWVAQAEARAAAVDAADQLDASLTAN
ncbi:COG4223 family protein [Loktanella sp. DJP18]|uniref:COG4223 family protein n=1 Tax=Loktanella sp. DJP18 TaxID=3409788 RepID=UPI003BB68A4E